MKSFIILLGVCALAFAPIYAQNTLTSLINTLSVTIDNFQPLAVTILEGPAGTDAIMRKRIEYTEKILTDTLNKLKNTPPTQIITDPLAFLALQSNVGELQLNVEDLRQQIENSATKSVEIDGITYTICTCGEIVATSTNEYLKQ